MAFEPLTSLLIRETQILARDFARVSRGFDELAGALRKHLRGDLVNDTVAPNKGRSGRETVEIPIETPSQPSLEFGSGRMSDFD